MNLRTQHFSADYEAARLKFLSIAKLSRAELAAFENPTTSDISNQTLTTDVALISKKPSRSILVLISGTHGVEGYCGSAIQCQFLEQLSHNKIDIEHDFLVVHAINPYGMAHYRRVNEDNVDLNRNFINFEAAPVNPGYEELHNFLVPEEWTGSKREQADNNIQSYAQTNGQRAMQAAVAGGQYTHADGLFFGGSAPVWSNIIWCKIVASYLTGYDHVAAIDFHTGLGPSGYGEPLFVGVPDSTEHDTARNWYGNDLTCPGEGDSASTSIQGPLVTELLEALPTATVVPIALEFGTYPVMQILQALRADNWLSVYGDPASELGRQIKSEIREAFYPDNDDWKSKILARGDEVIRQAIQGLDRGL